MMVANAVTTSKWGGRFSRLGEIPETLANPYGLTGRAMLKQMGLAGK